MHHAAVESDCLQLCWNCKIPVKITLSPSEITSPTRGTLKPLYLLVPRTAYLPTLTRKLVTFFQHVLPSVPGQGQLHPWFEFQGQPLRWHFPVGVLFDLLADQHRLPWELTVHFLNYPDVLLSLQGESAAENHFYNCLKEAGYICRGNDGSRAVMNLSSVPRQQLWQSLESADLAVYRQAIATMALAPSQRRDVVLSVPVRLMLRLADPLGNLLQWESTWMTSRPVRAVQQDGSPVTLTEALQLIRPDVFLRALASGSQAGAASAHPADSAASDPPAGAAAAGPESSGAPSPPAPAPEPMSPRPPEYSVDRSSSKETAVTLGGAGPAAALPPAASTAGQDGEGPAEGAGAERGMSGTGENSGSTAEALVTRSPSGTAPMPPVEHGMPGTAAAGGNSGSGKAETPVARSPSGTAPMPPVERGMPGTAAAGGSSGSGKVEVPVARSPSGTAPLSPVERTVSDASMSVSQLLPRQGSDSAAKGRLGGEWGGRQGGALVLVNGSEVPLDTPLLWLHSNMHAPDLFLYIIVILH